MTDSTVLSLRVAAERHNNSSDLSSQIQQIIKQKGTFRSVTEESLQGEIKQAIVNETRSETKDDGPSEHVEDDATVQIRAEKLWQNRGEMIQQLE